MQPQDKARLGLLYLQDHRGTISWEARQGLWIAGRVVDEDEFYRPLTQDNTYGDLLCALGWIPDTRRYMGWAFAWPAEIQTPAFLPKLFPVQKGNWTPDDRFKAMEAAHPPFAGRYPRGWGGVVLGATREDAQDPIWIPGHYGDVAANRAQHQVGTRVFDLHNDGAPSMWAQWQSLVRVARPREPKKGYWSASDKANALALQLGPTGSDDKAAGFMLCYAPVGDRPNPKSLIINVYQSPLSPLPESSYSGLDYLGLGTVVRDPPGVLTAMSWLRGGPIVVPHAGDQHYRGETEDGETILAGHLHKNTVFYGGIWDCPLDLQNTFEPKRVFSATSGKAWRVYCQVRGDASHQTPDGKTGATIGAWHVKLPILDDEDDQKPRRQGSRWGSRLALLRTWRSLGVPELTFIGNPVTRRDADLRHKEQPSDPDMERFNDAPVLFHWVAVGKEDGNGGWSRTTPGSPERYRKGSRPDGGGHADVILLGLPGSVGAEDYASGYAPAGQTVPSHGMALLPSSKGWGLGTPDPTLAQLKSGWWLRGDSDGNLWWYSTNADGSAETSRMRLSTTALRLLGLPYELAEIAAPGTPASGYVRLYAKTDRKLYWKDSTGTETAIGTLSSVPDASTTVKGIVELATSAETTAGLALQASDTRLPTQAQKDALAGTGTPSGSNKFVTNDDARLPTTGENDALVGTSGTPSSSNKYVTNADSRLFSKAYHSGYYSGQVSTYGDGLQRLVFGAGTVNSGITHSGLTGSFTVTDAGKYLVTVSIQLSAAGGYEIHVGAGSFTPGTGVAGCSGGGDQITMTAILNLSASGTFEVVENTAGVAPDTTNVNRTHITVTRIE